MITIKILENIEKNKNIFYSKVSKADSFYSIEKLLTILLRKNPNIKLITIENSNGIVFINDPNNSNKFIQVFGTDYLKLLPFDFNVTYKSYNIKKEINGDLSKYWNNNLCPNIKFPINDYKSIIEFFNILFDKVDADGMYFDNVKDFEKLLEKNQKSLNISGYDIEFFVNQIQYIIKEMFKNLPTTDNIKEIKSHTDDEESVRDFFINFIAEVDGEVRTEPYNYDDSDEDDMNEEIDPDDEILVEPYNDEKLDGDNYLSEDDLLNIL
jgi:hypothetical protein